MYFTQTLSNRTSPLSPHFFPLLSPSFPPLLTPRLTPSPPLFSPPHSLLYKQASCWIPILKAKRAVLVGDHKQLPPTVKSDAAQRQGLAITLFERLAANSTFVAAGLVFLLNTQYRMNALISSWASKSSYQGKLLSHSSCAERTVKVTKAGPKAKARVTPLDCVCYVLFLIFVSPYIYIFSYPFALINYSDH